ncbi:hypothetical protein [Clostridium baratii]|uniref:hypothetical protein n=1 Tax=Clostridium baratii TaxID=1561 RepID=UPI0005F2EA7E|nr:hypothetical protein [Clostridium baratii]AQM58567.1 hypothetical protein NPD11_3044 [Clostridium baratii]KJU71560.1 hypothetical protein UC77_09100 [Clostridium baratii]
MFKYLNPTEKRFLKKALLETIRYKNLFNKKLLDLDNLEFYKISLLSDLNLISNKYDLPNLNNTISTSLIKKLFNLKVSIFRGIDISIYDFTMDIINENCIEFDESDLSDKFADYCMSKYYFNQESYYNINQDIVFDEIYNVLIIEKIECGFRYIDETQEFEESSIDLENMNYDELYGAFKNGFCEVYGSDCKIINIYNQPSESIILNNLKNIFNNFFECTKALNFNSISYSNNTLSINLEFSYHHNNPLMIDFLVMLLLYLNLNNYRNMRLGHV